jgi:hypothetical protein
MDNAETRGCTYCIWLTPLMRLNRSMVLGRYGGAAQDPHASTLANPVDSRAGFAIGRRDLDIPTETNEIVEFQIVGEDLIRLVIAKSSIGHDQDLELGRSSHNQTNA